MKDSETKKGFNLRIRESGERGNSCILWFKDRDIDMERYDNFLARLPKEERLSRRARMLKLLDDINI